MAQLDTQRLYPSSAPFSFISGFPVGGTVYQLDTNVLRSFLDCINNSANQKNDLLNLSELDKRSRKEAS